MKVITLREPYATLVAYGVKKIDTRTYGTGYRGPIAIHASKVAPDKSAMHFLKDYVGKNVKVSPGFVIATARLIDCVKMPPVKQFYAAHQKGEWLYELPPDEPELSMGDYNEDMFCWSFRDPVLLKTPFRALGAKYVWEVDLYVK